MHMLETLDKIKWGDLQDALGPATSLPSVIRALASANPQLQQEALDGIWDRIWHYGRITEATPLVVPFLLELATSGRLGGVLNNVLELLYYIGDGPTPWAREITNLKTYGERAEYEGLVLLEHEVALSTDAINQILEQAETYIQEAHIAVRAGLSFYFELLQTSEDPSIREICTWLVVVFPERFEESTPRLRRLIDQESDMTVKATMIWGLGRLLGVADTIPHPQDLSFFSRLACSREHPLIYFYASAAYTYLAKVQTPPYLAALVATGIYWEWDPRDSPPLVTPGPILITQSIQIHGCRALSSLGADRAIPLLLWVLRRLTESQWATSYDVFEPAVGTLLELAFGPQLDEGAYKRRSRLVSGEIVRVHGSYYEVPATYQVPMARELTGLQRQVLEGLLTLERLWTFEDNIYTLYGLPSTRDSLRKFLAGRRLV